MPRRCARSRLQTAVRARGGHGEITPPAGAADHDVDPAAQAPCRLRAHDSQQSAIPTACRPASSLVAAPDVEAVLHIVGSPCRGARVLRPASMKALRTCPSAVATQEGAADHCGVAAPDRAEAACGRRGALRAASAGTKPMPVVKNSGSTITPRRTRPRDRPDARTRRGSPRRHRSPARAEWLRLHADSARPCATSP